MFALFVNLFFPVISIYGKSPVEFILGSLRICLVSSELAGYD